MTPSRLTLALTAIEECLSIALEDHPEDATDADLVEFAIDRVQDGDFYCDADHAAVAEYVYANREQSTAAAFAMLAILKQEAP